MSNNDWQAGVIAGVLNTNTLIKGVDPSSYAQGQVSVPSQLAGITIKIVGTPSVSFINDSLGYLANLNAQQLSSLQNRWTFRRLADSNLYRVAPMA